MTSVEAVPEEIRSAGLAARSLAAQVGSVDLAGPADSVSGWMPGGQAASAADELAGAWSREVAGLNQLLETYGANLQVCAAAFTRQDEHNDGATSQYNMAVIAGGMPQLAVHVAGPGAGGGS